MKKILALLLLLIVAFPVKAQSTDSPEKHLLPQNSSFVQGQVIVKYKNNQINLSKSAGKKNADALESKLGLTKSDEVSKFNIRLLKSNQSTEETIKQLESDPNVEYAQPNFKKQMFATPNDPHFSEQWALQNTGQTVNSSNGTAHADINATTAWDNESQTQPDVIVADIDTGADLTHQDLAGNFWNGSSCVDENNNPISGGCPNHGWNFADNNSNTQDFNGHGTAVAGIIAAVSGNSNGISGLSHYNHIKVMPIKFGFDTISELKAISFAKNNGVKIINASFGGSSFDQAEHDAIASFPGLFVAAAGNDSTNNDTTPTYPASYDDSNIISVAATDQNDNLASFSNYGTNSVDIAAPGKNIVSTSLSNGYAIGDGTSFAAPYVSGAAAMVESKFPSLSASDVKNQLLSNGDAIVGLNGKTATGKRLDLAQALGGSLPVYRFWSNSKQHHFYTISKTEKDGVIANDPSWRYEGIGYLAYASQQPGTMPVYRFWSQQKQGHFYTISQSEKDSVIANDPSWKYESVAFYAYETQQANTTPVYRFWSDRKQGHFFTISVDEKNSVIANDPSWRYEGIAYYVPTN
ncbi:MAG TPA: S8 family serine peptidase [Patescibacteria group bacterium]